MQALIIYDKDNTSPLFDLLHQQSVQYLKDKGYHILETGIGRGDLNYCMGCFGCWTKRPGECVINDPMAQINTDYINSDTVFYLCPVIFGQFSANIKNAIDRWLPNVLPFFITRPDGSTMHPGRYKNYPKQVMVGYGDDVSGDDKILFSDITKKHRRGVDVIWYETEQDYVATLDNIKLEKVGSKQ